MTLTSSSRFAAFMSAGLLLLAGVDCWFVLHLVRADTWMPMGNALWLAAGSAILTLVYAFLLYWLTYMLVRRRLHKLSEAMDRFVTSGFQGTVLFTSHRMVKQLPASLRRVLDPGLEIALVEASTELMASAIRESKRRMANRERQHLNSLSFLCHDLAAPLARVLSRVEALEYCGDLTIEERERILETTRVEITQATKLIASVSQFAQLESDIERNLEETPLNSILEHAVEVFEFDASKKSVELDLRVRPGVGLVRIEKSLIRRATENLISNALRFTPEGGLISVCAERCGNMAHIRVSDTGTGIPAEDIPHIFEFEFRGGGQTSPARFGSIGLGLALVRKVAEIHHGDVTARNLEPHGSEFVISLPTTD